MSTRRHDAKPVVRYPRCRCNGFNYGYGFYYSGGWHNTPQRGEYVQVAFCKKGLVCLEWETYPYTPVRQCDHCKRIRSTKRITVRGDCYDFERPELGTPMLCMACWNRYRPIIYALSKIRECQKLANKIRQRAKQKRAG